MTDEPNSERCLPSDRLCNKHNKPNPIKGDGALGNQYTGYMFYEGPDKKGLVIKVQQMLKELNYPLVEPEKNRDAAGVFGKKTEDAVKEFQDVHKDWENKLLNGDGLVGPRTSDALNRHLVGHEGWYDHYMTPLSITEGVPHHTVTVRRLKDGYSFDTHLADSEHKNKKKKACVFIAGEVPASALQTSLVICLADINRVPINEYGYTLEINEPNKVSFNGKTDGDGILSHKIADEAKTGVLTMEKGIFKLTIEKGDGSEEPDKVSSRPSQKYQTYPNPKLQRFQKDEEIMSGGKKNVLVVEDDGYYYAMFNIYKLRAKVFFDYVERKELWEPLKRIIEDFELKYNQDVGPIKMTPKELEDALNLIKQYATPARWEGIQRELNSNSDKNDYIKRKFILGVYHDIYNKVLESVRAEWLKSDYASFSEWLGIKYHLIPAGSDYIKKKSKK